MMHIKEIEFVKAMSSTKIRNLILTIEKGVEVQKLELLATHDEDTQDQISDACVFLSFLYFCSIQRQP